MTGLDEALRMLDLCESVGTDRYYVTKTDLLENKTRAWPTTAQRLHQTLPAVLRAAASRKPCRLPDGQTAMAGENVIIRPMSPTSTFIQLDDLSASALERVGPMAFLTLATSPGNHQAWIAVADLSGSPKDEAKEFIRRVKRGIGDKSASGSVRLAGTQNFKVKYYPDFPRVSIVAGAPGRIVTTQQLEGQGLVAPAEPAASSNLLQHGQSPFVFPAGTGRDVAQLPAQPRRRANGPTPQGAGSQHGRLYLVHDRHRLEVQRRSHRGETHGRKRARPRKRKRLRPDHRQERRHRSRKEPGRQGRQRA